MSTKLERIADKSAHTKRPEFTSLYHHINEEMLRACHKELDGNKAVGIDGQSKTEYEEKLDENIADLVGRLKRKAYHPQAVLRVNIPKSNGKTRPLGIAAYEDKIVQLALKKILEAIYEPKFQGNMYGFRQGKGCYDAIRAVYDKMNFGNINYVVDADIKGFFDHMDHEWIMKFVNLYIKDTNILRLIKRYLKSGVMEDGVLKENKEGSVQGNIISPILANIYMHNVLTLWYNHKIAKECKGDTFLAVYADDFIAGFEYKEEAERYYRELKERMAAFNLELEERKSRMMEFSRHKDDSQKIKGEKMETFNFLGFTFYYGRTRKGKPWVKLQTSRKKYKMKLRMTKEWLYKSRHLPMKELIMKLNMKLVGHYRYYGVSFNYRKITNYFHHVQLFLYKIINRRSNKRSYTCEGFDEMLKCYPLAKPKIYVSLFK